MFMHKPKILCKFGKTDKHIFCIYCLFTCIALLIRTIIPCLRCCRGFFNRTTGTYEDSFSCIKDSKLHNDSKTYIIATTIIVIIIIWSYIAVKTKKLLFLCILSNLCHTSCRQQRASSILIGQRPQQLVLCPCLRTRGRRCILKQDVVSQYLVRTPVCFHSMVVLTCFWCRSQWALFGMSRTRTFLYAANACKSLSASHWG